LSVPFLSPFGHRGGGILIVPTLRLRTGQGFRASPARIQELRIARRIQYLRAFLRVQPCQKLIILHIPLRFQLLYTLFCAARGIFLYLLGASGKKPKGCEAAQGAAFGAGAMKSERQGRFRRRGGGFPAAEAQTAQNRAENFMDIQHF